MKKSWKSSPHPISDIVDWHQAERLMLQPDYQRREVWSSAARIMLIDTILLDIPMPKIFVSNLIKDERTYRTVIDGQQRISAILGFLRNEFCLKSPYGGEYKNCYFRDLPPFVANEFLSYMIDFNEFKGYSENDLREIYSRVNKYTVALNKQELRRADFPGDFLKLADQLALNMYWNDTGIFSLANRRRFGDSEFVSELLAGLINGAQDKKETLDDFYQTYSQWNKEESSIVKNRFLAILADIEKLFSFSEKGIAKTRFRQKSDFYALFLAIDTLHQEGYSLDGKSLDCLQQDLQMLDLYIEPHSDIEAFREYATRCLSDANSKSSRLWRQNFLKKILSGTYIGVPPTSDERNQFFAPLLLDLEFMCELWCEPRIHICSMCNKEFQNESLEEMFLVWSCDSTVFQLSNSKWIHIECYQKNVEHQSINSNQQDLFEDTSRN